MRRVLFLAYHFPPVGGGGVQRSVRFCRHLRDFGYEPVVVTGPGSGGGRWTPRDASLAHDLPPDVEVLRVHGEPPSAGRLRRRGRTWLGMSSRFDDWWIDGAAEAARRTGGIDVVYASMSPYSSGDAARLIGAAIDRPWVADLRDPWALDEMTVYPTSLHRRRELRRMGAVLSSAASVIMNTPEAARRAVTSVPELESSAIVTIPNGWDADDFAGSEPVRSDNAFRIVHTGYLHADLGWELRRRRVVRRILGGAVNGADPLTRSHLFLLQAVEQVRTALPRLGSHIEVHLAGVLSEADRAIVRSSYVRTHGYLAHAESIDLIRSADLLFLPMHDLPTGTPATIVPGKTYEYLASGRPILAAVPDGDARDLLSAAPATAFVCRPDDVAGMASIIERQCWRLTHAGRAPTDVPAVASAYEAGELTARLAGVFDGVLGGADSLARRPRSGDRLMVRGISLLALTLLTAAGFLAAGWYSVSRVDEPRVSAGAQHGSGSSEPLAVAPTGSDDNPCTIAAPCASLDRAYRRARPGQVVEIAGGTYPEQTIRADPRKTSGEDVVLRPAPHSRVVIDGGLVVEASHIELRGLKAGLWKSRLAADQTFRNLDVGLFFIHGSRNVRVLGGDVGPYDDNDSQIASVDGQVPTDILIERVRFHDARKVDPKAHTECLQIGSGVRVVIRAIASGAAPTTTS